MALWVWSPAANHAFHLLRKTVARSTMRTNPFNRKSYTYSRQLTEDKRLLFTLPFVGRSRLNIHSVDDNSVILPSEPRSKENRKVMPHVCLPEGLTASASYQPHIRKSMAAPPRAMFDAWQVDLIASHNSPAPFTLCDSTNTSLRANSPPISGYPASRPNLIGNLNSGPHTVQDWINTAAFQRWNPVTPAAQFGKTLTLRALGRFLPLARRGSCSSL